MKELIINGHKVAYSVVGGKIKIGFDVNKFPECQREKVGQQFLRYLIAEGFVDNPEPETQNW